jgi:predicted nucleic acid-binding protein
MKYLVDTSALVRIVRRQVALEWYELVDRGLTPGEIRPAGWWAVSRSG